MSLNDVDKTGDSRIQPTVNHTDTIIDGGRTFHATNSVNYTTASSDVTKLTEGRTGRFQIVSVGQFTQNLSFATTNPGAGKFARDVNTFRTDTHSLGFVPTVMAYIVFGTGIYTPLPLVSFQVSGTTIALWTTVTTRVTNTTIAFDYITNSTGGGWTVSGPITIKYYLLQQRAS